MKTVVVVLVIISLFSIAVDAEEVDSSLLHLGIEADLLYFATGGYNCGLLTGYGRFRIRMAISQYYWPDSFQSSGWQDQEGWGYGIYLGDITGRGISGFSVEMGIEYWDDELTQPEGQGLVKRTYSMAVVNVGYRWNFYKQLYVHPSVVFNYDYNMKHEYVGNRFLYPDGTFHTGFSLIIGWHFK